MAPSRSAPVSRLAALALAVLLLACGGRTAPPPGPAVDAVGAIATPPGALPIDPAIRVGKLANGVTFYVRKNAKPEKRAALWLAVDAGAVLEDDDQRGLAHFLEHMAFNGTKKYAKQAIVDYLEKTGMRFGADVNASTSFDETIYQLELPTDDAATLEHGLDILHEWAHGIALDPEEVKKERGVVLEEWRLGRGAQGRLLDQLMPIVFKGSRYADRLPIGKKEIIEGATPELAGRFYRDWYRPERMAVFAVGDFEPDQLEAMIRKQFGDLAAAAPERPRPAAEVPSQAEAQTAVLTDPELPVTAVVVASRLPAARLVTEADWRATMLEQLFDTMLTHRLDERKEQKGSPLLGAGAARAPIVRAARGWFAFGVVKGDAALAAMDVLLEEVERVRQHGFTAGELDRAKKDMLRGLEASAAQKDQRPSAEHVQEMVRNFLTQEAMPGAEAELALAQRLLATVTPAEVAALAAGLAADQDRVLLVVGNPKMKMPSVAEVQATASAARGKSLLAYVDGGAVTSLLPEPPTPGTIASRRTIDELGVTQWMLGNGATVTLKPTTFEKDRVHLVGLRPGGTSRASDADYWAASFAPDIAARGGFGALGRIQLERALSGTGVGLDTGVDELYASLRGGAPPRYLETLLQLAHLELTAPRHDPDSFATWQTETATVLRDQDRDPGAAFGKKFDLVYGQGKPRRRDATAAEVEAIELGRALAAYQDQFGGARGWSFVLVGNFDPATVEPLVVRYLGGLPAGGKKPAWRDVGAWPPGKTTTFEHSQGQEAKAAVKLVFHGKAPWSLQSTLELEAAGQVLAMRLREILREDMGGVYGVGVSGALVRDPKPHYEATIYFGCAPEHKDALIKATFDEIAALQAKGPEQSYVDKIKLADHRGRETDLTDNGFWLGQLVRHVAMGLDPRELLGYDGRVDKLTPASMRAVFKRHFKAPYVQGVLLPEKAAAAPR